MVICWIQQSTAQNALGLGLGGTGDLIVNYNNNLLLTTTPLQPRMVK